MVKRNATEMAVTNRRVLIKTGMGSRRTLDLMLSRVESIGVEETMWGRMLGYGSVIVRGTGGTPEPFVPDFASAGIPETSAATNRSERDCQVGSNETRTT